MNDPQEHAFMTIFEGKQIYEQFPSERKNKLHRKGVKDE